MNAVAPLINQENVAWEPQYGSQTAFLTCPLFEVMLHGNRGGGKTDSLIMDFAQHVGKGYGADWRGILFRQTFPQLQDVIAKTKKWFFRIWQKDVDVFYNESSHTWKWATGEELYLRQINKDADYWNFHGHEYPWIGWEELCNWSSPTLYKRMFSCCRSSNKDVPRKIRATTNPYGPGHNWVKFRFRLPGWSDVPILDSVDEDGNIEPSRMAIQSSLSENRVLLNSDPDYRQRILAAARNKAERDAWDVGSWDIIAGGMFDDVWNPSTHIVQPFTIPHSWKIDRSFDWGSSRPFSVGWWAESDGTDYQDSNGQWRSSVRGDLYRINEWYGWNGKPNEGCQMLAVEIAKGIVEREVGWGFRTVRGTRVKPGPADTSIWTVENGNDIASDMAKPITIGKHRYNGVQWTRADKRAGSRIIGWEAIRKVLKAAAPVDGKPRETPGLFVFNTCTHFQRTVPVLPRDEKKMDDVDTDAEDHTADEVRYRVRFMGIVAGNSGNTVGMF